MSKAETVKKGFQEYLNSHGYSFQYAVIKVSENEYRNHSPWTLPTIEFPVTINNANTRVDLVFEHFRFPRYLVAECKRVNPALGNWCFARSPYADSVYAASRFYAEQLFWDGPNVRTEIVNLGIVDNICHLGAEVRASDRGDSQGSGRGAIEEAATQLLRGYNGIIDLLKTIPAAGKNKSRALFVPVLFTTARLWISTADLSLADVVTGNMDLTPSELKETPWLIYQYPQSRALRHSLESVTSFGEENLVTRIMYRDFIRCIAVVSASGIPSFLKWNLWNH